MIRVQWRALTAEEKQLVDGIRVKYRQADGKDSGWKMSEVLHRDTFTYELSKIRPNTRYTVDLDFVPSTETKVVSGKAADILTPNDRFSFKVK